MNTDWFLPCWCGNLYPVVEGYKQLLHNWNENEWGVLEDSRGLSVASVPTTRSDKVAVHEHRA